jgi:uncharacterized repeat protein (TIGR01451 family)
MKNCVKTESMNKLLFFCLGVMTGLSVLVGASAQVESHRATRLGNPATRFAPPRSTPEDLRALFRDEKLRPDFAAILKQWGWQGNIDDMFAAAATAEISDIKIPIGTTMPFMSSRENGKAICLRNVLWAGNEPAPAFAFNFTSKGQRYRCVTPKACSNFFLEGLGPELKPVLTLKCDAPEKAPAGRPANVCLTVVNTGNAPEPLTRLTLHIPEGAEVVSRTDRGVQAERTLTWEIPNLAPNHGKQVCASVKLADPGNLSFTATVSGRVAAPASASACQTEFIGIPAILLEVVDLEDPIEVGKEVTYDIKVTNQGTAIGTNIRLACALPASQEFISGSGVTSVRVEDRTVTIDALPTLDARAVAAWRVVVKASLADDARFKVELHSDQFERPIKEDESTQQY